MSKLVDTGHVGSSLWPGCPNSDDMAGDADEDRVMGGDDVVIPRHRNDYRLALTSLAFVAINIGIVTQYPWPGGRFDSKVA